MWWWWWRWAGTRRLDQLWLGGAAASLAHLISWRAALGRVEQQQAGGSEPTSEHNHLEYPLGKLASLVEERLD